MRKNLSAARALKCTKIDFGGGDPRHSDQGSRKQTYSRLVAGSRPASTGRTPRRSIGNGASENKSVATGGARSAAHISTMVRIEPDGMTKDLRGANRAQLEQSLQATAERPRHPVSASEPARSRRWATGRRDGRRGVMRTGGVDDIFDRLKEQGAVRRHRISGRRGRRGPASSLYHTAAVRLLRSSTTKAINPSDDWFAQPRAEAAKISESSSLLPAGLGTPTSGRQAAAGEPRRRTERLAVLT